MDSAIGTYRRAAVMSRAPVALHLLVVLACGWLMISCASAAGVYKWVDEKGKVHYGDRPPSTSTSSSVKVRPGTASSAAPASEAERAQRRRQLLHSFEADRAERAQQRAKDREALAKKKELRRKCAFAREDLTRLQGAGYLYDYDDKGERRILSDEQRASYVKKYSAGVKKHCK